MRRRAFLPDGLGGSLRMAVLAVSVGLVAAGLAGAPGAQAAQRHPHPGGYTPPPVAWAPCEFFGIAAECGMLTVPLDYRHPSGAKIQLAVSRVRHTVPDSEYQGVMLVNPGGPGGSGLVYSVLGGAIPNDAGAAYDWIGFDPRGVGSSVPSLSCDSGYTDYGRPSYIPFTRSIEQAWLRKTREYAEDCEDAGGELLDHVKTTDTVADMESLRKALGERQINFYGFSYGTYLAQVYATLHPGRVRRMVLDSNVDPRRVWYDLNLDQDLGFQTTVEVYFGWLARYDSVYHLGTTRRAVQRLFNTQLRRLTVNPADGVFGPNELTDVFTVAAYYVYDWTVIADAFAAWVNDGDASGLREYWEASYPTDEGADNGYAMYLGTECTDARWPQSWQAWRRDNWRMFARAPFLTWSNAWFNAPCRDWAGRVGRPVRVDGRRVPGDILLVDETLDPATPFEGSLEVRSRFPRSSLIEGVGGTTHAGSLSGVACVDDAIAAYLADGTVPPRLPGRRSDLQCDPVPQPVPEGARQQPGTRAPSRAEPGMPDVLRAALMAAQPH